MVRVNRNDDFVEGQQQPNTIHLWVVVLVVVVIGIGFYFYNSANAPAPDQNSVPIPVQTLSSDNVLEKAESSLPDTEGSIDNEVEETSFLLPELDNSDLTVRQIAPSITDHPAFASWLTVDELVRTFTLLIDNMSRGDLIRKPFKQLAPKQPFKARELADGVYMTDPSSYRRFDLFVGIFESFDSRISMALYLKLKPLFQEAYGELGYPDQDFDKTLMAAFDVILAAPVISRPLKLDRPSVMFKFSDENIEALNDVQKQMIRMGPKNTKKIQAKIRDLVKLFRETKT